jgi:Na+/melibiose symporter-like transporter
MAFQKWNLMGSDLFFQPVAEQRCPLPGWRRCYMSIGTIILIILIIALLGGFSGIGGGPFYGTGYYGGGGLGLVIVILLILLLLGRL